MGRQAKKPSSYRLVSVEPLRALASVIEARRELVGKFVIVRKTMYKGLLGKVREVTESGVVVIDLVRNDRLFPGLSVRLEQVPFLLELVLDWPQL